MGRNIGDFTYGIANKVAGHLALNSAVKATKKAGRKVSSMSEVDLDRHERMEKASNSVIGKALGWDKRNE
jgi:hypothetical protein